MPYQNISASVSAPDLTAIKASVAEIRAKLPFLVGLTADERRSLFKAGDKRLSFVQDALTAAQNNPSILPATFETAEFEKDVHLAATLSEILLLLQQITSEVDDTLLAASAEAMASATNVYDYVKTAAKSEPGLKPVADSLAAQFKRASSRTTPQASPPKKTTS